MVTIKDVARKAQVSVPTVYKVFSNYYTTGADIREKVLDAAKELNYVHKSSEGKGAVNKGTKVIAAVITETAASNGFYSYVIKDLIDALDRFGFRLIIMYTEKDSEREKGDFQILLDEKVDGIMFTPASEKPIELIEQLIEKKFPLIQLFNNVYPELDTLLFDDELGTYLAVKNLIQCGHEKIMLMTRKTNHTNPERLAGYNRAFNEAGIKTETRMIKLFAYAESVKEMIKDNIIREKPTAIISVSEGISTCVIQSIKELKLSIPDDISLIAYDDFPWLSAYEISAVAHPFESIGSLCAQLINNRILEVGNNKRELPSTLVLDPKLISRNSVKILK